MQEMQMSPSSRSDSARETQLLALNAHFAAAKASEEGRELAALAQQMQAAAKDSLDFDAQIEAGGEPTSSRVDLWHLELQQRLRMVGNAVARWMSTVSTGVRVR